MVKYLGSHIESFDCSIGWGNSESSLDVTLIDCEGDGGSFTPALIGGPTRFRYENFDYFGILDKYNTQENDGAYPKHTVNVTNGLDILNGVELIINDYYGSVNSVPNLLNVFGYLENSGGFGASELNEAGMPWKAIKEGIHGIVNSPSVGNYGNGITYKGFRYKIDLTDLPSALPPYYRFNGDNISLTDFIDECCLAGGADYFISMQPALPVESGTFVGTFKINTVDRSTEATTGNIATYIGSNCISDREYGLEMRRATNSKFVVGPPVDRVWFAIPDSSGVNDPTGGITQAEYANDIVLPYFGLDSNGDYVIGFSPSGDTSEYYFAVDIKDAGYPQVTNYLTCLGELRAAKKGRLAWEGYLAKRNFNRYLIEPTGSETEYFESDVGPSGFIYGTYNGADTYVIPKFGYEQAYQQKGRTFAHSEYPTSASRVLSYKHNNAPNPYFWRATALGLPNAFGISAARMFEGDLYTKASTSTFFNKVYTEFKNTLGVGNEVLNSACRPSDARNSSKFEDFTNGNIGDKTLIVYKKIKDLADNYYNRRYMVVAPFTLGTVEPESFNIRTSNEPTDLGYLDESQWAGAYSNGFIPDISGISTITSPDNRFHPYVKYENALIVSTGTGIISGLYDFSEISSENKIASVPVTATGFTYYDIFIRCSTFDNLVYQDASTFLNPRIVLEMPGVVKPIEDVQSYAKSFFNLMNDVGNGPGGAFENDASVNNEFIQKRLDKVGADKIQFHDGENFHYANLYAVPLRSNLLSYGPWYAVGADGGVRFERQAELTPWNYGGFTALNQAGNARAAQEVTNQTFEEAGSVTVMGSPVLNPGSQLIVNGPYITDMNVSVSDDGVKTTYRMQSWSSHRAIDKLRSHNNNRLQRFIRQSYQAQRIYREGLKSGRFKNAVDFISGIANQAVGLEEYGQRNKPSTSHNLIGGQFNGLRSEVVIQPFYNTASQLSTDYFDKAFMTLDGLYRPVSTVEHTGMTHFQVPHSSIEGITALDLNPWQSGHDLGFITRGTGVDALYDPVQNTGWYDEFRGLGVKYPEVAVGWGRDQHGKPYPADTGDPNIYSEDYLSDSKNWAAGPVDMRFDTDYKLWQAPPVQMGITYTEMDAATDITAPSKCWIYRYSPSIIGSSGHVMSSGEVYCFDKSMGIIPTGTLVYYYNIAGINHLIYAACSPDSKALEIVNPSGGGGGGGGPGGSEGGL
jgi:hypothetical protein